VQRYTYRFMRRSSGTSALSCPYNDGSPPVTVTHRGTRLNHGVYALIQGEIANICFGIKSDPVTARARKVATVRGLEHEYQREPLSSLEAVFDNVE
jgi:hypothetical protein